MKSQRLLLTAFCSLALFAAATPARAETADDMSFSGMFQLDRIDANKDGAVSKAEFLAQMGRLWEMKAKEMKVKADKMTAAEFKEMTGFLSRGEKNK